MKKDTVLRIVDSCFHEFASDKRELAKNKAIILYDHFYNIEKPYKIKKYPLSVGIKYKRMIREYSLVNNIPIYKLCKSIGIASNTFYDLHKTMIMEKTHERLELFFNNL